MNIYANGNGRGKTAMEFEANSYSELELDYFKENPKTASAFKSKRKDEREFNLKQTLQSISKVASRIAPLAQYLAPITANMIVNAVPGAKRNFNPLTAQLLYPLLQKGDRDSRRKEAEFFGTQAADVEVANTGIAHEAALTEVLAAEASHTESESEAAALIGTALPIAFRVMDGRQLLRPVLPMLLVATARLVRFLHRHSRDSRRLLRLVPTILRRTVASLLAARRWGCPMTSALVGCVVAAQTKRVLGNSQLVYQSITRNALIRISTVAAAPRNPLGYRRSFQRDFS
ncbi:hypothetical protein [Nostoc sp. GT001]|uniref:hypothetical protein n=1 Tax=Nostoc sp. GT001 TaxID=3056647 RepID=UPI0025AA9986|nr:hypothetical protein [Nostoc sp. GT001]MDM9580118.1 hypothetical protein [Nostoc sp. GT001]